MGVVLSGSRPAQMEHADGEHSTGPRLLKARRETGRLRAYFALVCPPSLSRSATLCSSPDAARCGPGGYSLTLPALDPDSREKCGPAQSSKFADGALPARIAISRSHNLTVCILEGFEGPWLHVAMPHLSSQTLTEAEQRRLRRALSTY